MLNREFWNANDGSCVNNSRNRTELIRQSQVWIKFKERDNITNLVRCRQEVVVVICVVALSSDVPTSSSGTNDRLVLANAEQAPANPKIIKIGINTRHMNQLLYLYIYIYLISSSSFNICDPKITQKACDVSHEAWVGWLLPMQTPVSDTSIFEFFCLVTNKQPACGAPCTCPAA